MVRFMNYFNIPGALQTAIGHHQNGRLIQAQALYQQILQANPKQPDALHLLGLIEHQQGQSQSAMARIQKAVELRPRDVVFRFNLANMYLDLKLFDQAIASYRKALQLQPGVLDILLGLRLALLAQNRDEEAIAIHRQILAIEPNRANIQFDLANLLRDQGQLGEAILVFKKSIALNPLFTAAYINLANALSALGRVDEAIENIRMAIKVEPDHVGSYANLAIALCAQGNIDEAIPTYRKALALNAFADAATYSGMLFAMQYQSTCSAEDLFLEHQNFAAQYEAPLKPHWQPHNNPRDPKRRLKVGYVSGDFRQHPVAYFIEPILACHQRALFEVYGYSNCPAQDDYTARISANMDHWCACHDMNDDQLAQRIRADGIDILVDLSGHTAFNRLTVFARKPAPVQVTWVGYPGTTGLTAIDYRLSDPWQDPPGVSERYHSETVVRLPSGMAFAPDAEAPPVNDLPALHSAQFVLACLNNLSKVNDAVLALWSRILHALPQARLMLGNVIDDHIRQRLLGRFSQNQIGPERLILQPRVPMAEYLALHNQIDLALDPFPYNGGTTTMHSLWMGVPVVTLAGDHAVSRLCAAHLSRVDLTQFIAHTEDEYLQCVLHAAQNLPKLNRVRQSLRQRMNEADCDPATITHHLEAAYRDMWQKWCNL